MDVKYVRMFGDKVPPGESRDDVIARVVEGFQKMAAHAKAAGVVVLMESHGDFTNSADIARDSHGGRRRTHFSVLWDAHHTFVAGGEAPAETYAALGKWIRHTHLKDSKPQGDDRRYVLTGTGEVPVKAQVKVLAAAGYKGYYSFEWEKKWHPGDRRARGGVPALRQDDGRVPGGRRGPRQLSAARVRRAASRCRADRRPVW